MNKRSRGSSSSTAQLPLTTSDELAAAHDAERQRRQIAAGDDERPTHDRPAGLPGGLAEFARTLPAHKERGR